MNVITWTATDGSGNIDTCQQNVTVADNVPPTIVCPPTVILAANGEIYNHRELREELKEDYSFKTASDCEIILALYKEKGTAFLNDLNGIFGFALYDSKKDAFLVARDHMGIIPLYRGWDKNGTVYIASELKALEGTCTKIELFPPGHYWFSEEQMSNFSFWLINSLV